MKLINCSTTYQPSELLNLVLNYQMKSVEYTNNLEVITKLSSILDSIIKKENGHTLFTITRDLNVDIILIIKTTSQDRQLFKLFKWQETNAIEYPLAVEIQEDRNDSNLGSDIDRTKGSNYDLSIPEILSYCITKGLTGYSINLKRFDSLLEFSKVPEYTLTKQTKKEHAIGKHIKGEVDRQTQFLAKKLQTFCQKNGAQEIRLNIRSNNVNTNEIKIGYISKVLELGNSRHFIMDTYKYVGEKNAIKSKGKFNHNKLDSYRTQETSSTHIKGLVLAIHHQYASSALSLDLTALPYNYVDEGRYVIAINIVGNNLMLITDDPKVNPEIETKLFEYLTKFIESQLFNFCSIDARIKVKKKITSIGPFLASVNRDFKDLKPMVKVNKALKTMIDEYKYISKKKKVVGSDIQITDKIKYNHAEGKVSYNDFSIAINEDLLKAKLFNLFNDHLLEFYRGNITEEEILNNILDNIFSRLSDVVLSTSSGTRTIPITINDKINILVEKRLLIYINNIRFNKNEVISILKELTCYRDQAAADMFINNIGKVGLSVYIGITTGYDVTLGDTNKIFKFKKNPGRSNYTLLLDDTELPFKGKDVITLLYKNFNHESITYFQTKLELAIYEGVGSSLNYIKYKFLIDEAYKAFKQKSEEFLAMKVTDIEGEFVEYINEKQTKLKGVKLTGLSGNVYIVAYDKESSYVFMNPTKMSVDEIKIMGLKEDLSLYNKGKYICMIDQSNIKSNIGYDTVVAKLMALKNDSIIASTIYNLNDQLAGDLEDENREND